MQRFPIANKSHTHEKTDQRNETNIHNLNNGQARSNTLETDYVLGIL